MNNKLGNGKRGRPIGYKLSEESKRAISASKKGQVHKQVTKDKISRALIVYFRKKNPVSVEMINYYGRISGQDACDWIGDASEVIDECEEIITEKALRNKQKMEITCGANIELFSHRITPELLMLFKEHCEKLGKTPDAVYDELDKGGDE